MSHPLAKARSAQHPSVAALLVHAMTGETPEAVIRRKSRDLVAFGKGHGWAGPPFKPEILASLKGIKVRDVPFDFGSAGRILPVDGYLVIECAAGSIPERRNYTVCHELVHTLFPDFGTEAAIGNNGGICSSAVKALEVLCDVGASELLLPHDEFKDAIADREPNFSTIHTARVRFAASIDATVRRLVDLWPGPLAAVFLSDVRHRHPSDEPKCLRICFFRANQKLRDRLSRVFFEPQSAIPSGSICELALGHGCEATPLQLERWICANRVQEFLVTAASLPAIPTDFGYPKVVAILRPPS